jgi:hypothetical protein
MTFDSVLTHWKSTVSGILTVTLSTTAAFLVPPLSALIAPKHVLYITAIQAVGKIWIAIITQDAGTVMATVPGNPEPQAVAAHSVPDNPKATPVLPEVTP